MKKAIITLALVFCISAEASAQARIIRPIDLNPDAVETELFGDSNTRDIKGVVRKITKGKRNVKISVYAKADKRKYSITLSKGEYADWIAEQGKVCKGTKVRLWTYTMETETVKDDVVLNIRK